jgi:hypothetical protein
MPIRPSTKYVLDRHRVLTARKWYFVANLVILWYFRENAWHFVAFFAISWHFVVCILRGVLAGLFRILTRDPPPSSRSPSNSDTSDEKNDEGDLEEEEEEEV